MTTAHDVAAYILQKQGSMTAMKLQKLAYYSQAWNLVWNGGQSLFPGRIEAWKNGPVIPALFPSHKGKYLVNQSDFPLGNCEALSVGDKAVVDDVLDFYGGMTSTQLSILTHAEAPWIQARGSAPEGVNSRAVISPASMEAYYRALNSSPDAAHSVEDINFPAWAG